MHRIGGFARTKSLDRGRRRGSQFCVGRARACVCVGLSCWTPYAVLTCLWRWLACGRRRVDGGTMKQEMYDSWLREDILGEDRRCQDTGAVVGAKAWMETIGFRVYSTDTHHAGTQQN